MTIRLSTRAIILCENRLLLVNAYPDGQSDLWCAPGGGAEPGQSLPDNLKREVHEETGLQVQVGAPCLINEFHDPQTGFHQVDLFFRCIVTAGQLDPHWSDPEGVVSARRFFAQDEAAELRLKPDSLVRVAFSGDTTLLYDPLERLLPP